MTRHVFIAFLRWVACMACFFAGPAIAQTTSPDFARDVQPILRRRCYRCHGQQIQESGLRLDSRQAAVTGGESHGPAIRPGRDNHDAPLLRRVVSQDPDERMPPDAPLPPEELTLLRRWLETGADWPEQADEGANGHWSFRPLAVPRGRSLDGLVERNLVQHGIAPLAETSPREWLRRAYLILVGVPPTPREVDDFLGDRRPLARELVIDRLLASPRFGERQAQHWLDVVRYADTHGFEVNTERPNAWPFRDYVIRAWNEDRPYDRFVTEQLAGDALGRDAATGFLVTASVLLPGQIGKDAESIRLARQDAIDEIVVNISRTFLGLSIGCARCHDHKFDPISQRDYYAMQAFVAGVEYGERAAITPTFLSQRGEASKLRAELAEQDRRLMLRAPLVGRAARRPSVLARYNVDRFTPLKARRVRLTVLATNNREPCIDELEVLDRRGVNIARADQGAKVSASGSNVAPNRHELRFVNDGRYGNSRSWMSNEVGGGWVEITLPRATEIQAVVWGRDRQGKFADRLATAYRIEVAEDDGPWRLVADASDRKAFDQQRAAKGGLAAAIGASDDATARHVKRRNELASRLARSQSPPRVFAGVFREPDDIRWLLRGDPEQPQDRVRPAIPVALNGQPFRSDLAPGPAALGEPEQQRRRRLASWITDPSNPLPARVFVNRLWQANFGVGLVETSNDLGLSGATPSNPHLLDWLAATLLREGWSLKRLQRRIALSTAFARNSTAGRLDETDPRTTDARSRHLWRYPARRLDAESIRDSMLAVSGELNSAMYGRGFDLFDKRGGLSGFQPVEQFSAAGLRRMIYAHKVRRERDAVFGVFDCPDGGQSAARRRESVTPIQALNLFNSQFTLDRSRAFAQRLEHEAGRDIQTQVRRAWRLALQREATRLEQREAALLVRRHGLPTLCRVLFNSNEFVWTP